MAAPAALVLLAALLLASAGAQAPPSPPPPSPPPPPAPQLYCMRVESCARCEGDAAAARPACNATGFAERLRCESEQAVNTSYDAILPRANGTQAGAGGAHLVERACTRRRWRRGWWAPSGDGAGATAESLSLAHFEAAMLLLLCFSLPAVYARRARQRQ